MKLSNLKTASKYEVQNWLKTALDLTPYQISKMNNDETIRWSRFKFYQERKEKDVSLWWRLTIPFYPIFWVLLCIAGLLKWVVTGKTGLPQKFLDKYYYPWCNKINI